MLKGDVQAKLPKSPLLSQPLMQANSSTYIANEGSFYRKKNVYAFGELRNKKYDADIQNRNVNLSVKG